MPRIKIRNFGPIKEGYLENDGWMDIKKVTVFIGNQGSGKSTVAKLISTMTWFEKAINRRDFDPSWTSRGDLLGGLHYQRILSYRNELSQIEYDGQRTKISINPSLNSQTIIEKLGSYSVPKIMYVPAERNFLSVVENAYGLSNLPGPLRTFAEELKKGQLQLNGTQVKLPLGGVQYKYDKQKDKAFLKGKGFEIDVTESSSGFQSFAPLYLVSKFLSEEVEKGEEVLKDQLSADQLVRRTKEISNVSFDVSLSPQEKDARIKEIDSRYLSTCFINIVEEPEQNLFPDSQRIMLNSLLEFNNKRNDNKLIITTHSPYLINYLTLAVKGEELWKSNLTESEQKALEKIVPRKSALEPDDLVVYQLDEKKGTITRLETFDGLPSDENYLNEKLMEGNDLYAKLLRIQQRL